ncbi:MAG: 2-amino-4-hydroxy-6-hydroxymethyldihydropteridine diphosphokinase [Methylophilaceae bacterium]
MHKAYIALGSNLSNPESQIIRALQSIDKLPKTQLINKSSLYQTAPVGYDEQPDFINAVAEVATDLNPQDLMQQLLTIEQAFGRERPFPNSPRILDLDLLLYDDLVLSTENLTLPHPRMHLRGFVLLPLAEIAPDLTLPDFSLPFGGNVVKLAELHKNQGVEKVNP